MATNDSSEVEAIQTEADTLDIELVARCSDAARDAPSKTADPFLVEFDTPFDRDNPRDWSRSKKWTATDVLSATGFNRIVVSTIMAPALSAIASDLHMSSVESSMALSIYLLATAFGPLILGPMSEVYGRKPMLHGSNIAFLVFNLICGFANSKGLLIAARFLAGLGASAIYALAGGVLGDLWRAEERGKTLAIYIVIPLIGAAVGPIIGGFIVAHTTWRWIFWSTSIFQAAMVALSWFSFEETLAPLILNRRVQKLRKQSGDQRYHTASERRNAGQTLSVTISRTLSRPIRLLAFHPVVQIIAVLSGLGYGLLYLVLTTYATLWTRQYHESTEIAGLHYISSALGELVGSQVTGRAMDIIFRRLQNRRGSGSPELHLPMAIPGAVFAATGLLAFGWAANYHAYWLVVDFGVFLMSFGLQIQGQPLQGYIIDAFPDHTSSATAASQFLRSMAAFSFPLFAPRMYDALGYGIGNTIIAATSLVIMVPGLFVLWIYGPRLRTKAGSSL